MSDGIYSCPMDPMDSIGTTFDPLVQHDEICVSLLRTENQDLRWNLFMSDGSNRLRGLVSSVGWVPDCRAGGGGFEPRPDQYSGS